MGQESDCFCVFLLFIFVFLCVNQVLSWNPGEEGDEWILFVVPKCMLLSNGIAVSCLSRRRKKIMLCPGSGLPWA